MQAGGQVAVLLDREAYVEESVHGGEEAIDAVVFAGKTQLGHAPQDFLFQLILGLHLGL